MSRRARTPPSAGRLGGVLLGVWAALAAPSVLQGCSTETRYRVLSTVFDGVPPPGSEPRPRRRRIARRETKPLPAAGLVEGITLEQVEEEPRLRFASYEELAAALPKDTMANLDWVAAVEKGLIEPRPGIGPDAQAMPVLPHDVRLDPGIPQLEVVFPHAAHTYWLRCESCHPGIFQMKAGADPITMDRIFQGEYCGRCHGKVAFPPQTGCPRCHVRMGGAAG